MVRLFLWIVCLAVWGGCTPTDSRLVRATDSGARDAAQADAETEDAAAPPELRRLARNIIVFMGDGMGPAQFATARFGGAPLRVDVFNGPALAVTDSLTTLHVGGPDPPATDSAAGATWIATGVRVDNDYVSVTADGEPLETVLELCRRAGKATGLVTTSYFFDASPAAFAAHQHSRANYAEIIREMLSITRPDVIMGGGAVVFDDPVLDLQPLAAKHEYTVVRSLAELEAWDPAQSPRLLALFATDFVPLVLHAESFTMTPAIERTASSPDPSLATMTQRALDRLSRDPDGFFLFAEDEITDSIGHRGPAEVAWANRALPAQIRAIDAAIGVAVDWVLEHSSFDETLIVLLADHETGGYVFDPTLGPESGNFLAFVDDGMLRTGYHTRRPIEVYAIGPGSDAVEQIASHGDSYQMLVGTLR